MLALAVMPPAAWAQSLPSGWTAQDIGSVGAGGWASGSGSSYFVAGAGADIWGSSDGFHFAYRTLNGDGEIVARVDNIDYAHAWSKAGVMMRESLRADAAHAYALVSAGKGTAFQRRPATGAPSEHSDGGWGRFVKLVRSGSSFTAYSSSDGWNWQWVGTQTITMSSSIYVGLAVTSHYYGAISGGSFAEVSVSETGTSSSSSYSAPAPAPVTSSLPGEWGSGDVGWVAAGGWSSGSGGDFSVAGSGADIWGGSDAFQFAYRTLSGDGSITARVTHVDYQHAWSKAGVMMRESLDAGSRHAYMLVSAGKGLAFQRRTSTSGSSTSTSMGWGSAPYYVRLTRSGSTFTAEMSSDGSSWTWVGSEWISMSSTIYVGLAVTSHADGSVSNANFSSVSVSAGTTTTTASVASQPTSSTTSSLVSGTGTSLRVLHWNVHHGGIGTDGVYDPGRVAEWIAHMNPDVASLNEVDDESQLWAIVNRLQSITGVTWNVVFSGRGNLLLSRLPVSTESICTYNSWYPRRAPHIRVVVNGRNVNIWSSHLDVNSSGTRLEEIYALQGCAAAWSGAAILAGDYNMQASSSEYSAAVSGYTDAWLAAKYAGTTQNYSGNCDGCTRNSRIDYVFSGQAASYLTVESARVYDTRNSYGYMPSDHKPLVVTYSVR